MTTALTIKPATRQGVKPLIGLYSESGCGKTFSSLLLARGMAGPTGKIVLIDSESGRGSLYADVIPGGYDVLELGQPFSPARYIEAIAAAEASGAAVACVDSASHEWEGLGGVLDMAGDNETRTGKPGLHNWKGPKMEHAKMMLKLLQSRLPIIVCLRAKYKTRQQKDEKGRTAIVKDDYTTPIQADDFIFEMMAHAEILPDHSINLTKCSHPSLRECFPAKGKGPITIQHGEALARWCANPGTVATPTQVAGSVPKAGSGASMGSTAASLPKIATEEQRVKMFTKFRDAGIVESTLKSFAEQKAWLAPFDELGTWPLKHVPTTTGQMASLIVDIQAWKDGR